jgi:t-SNARE complex subunit (syntaxin)
VRFIKKLLCKKPKVKLKDEFKELKDNVQKMEMHIAELTSNFNKMERLHAEKVKNTNLMQELVVQLKNK